MPLSLPQIEPPPPCGLEACGGLSWAPAPSRPAVAGEERPACPGLAAVGVSLLLKEGCFSEPRERDFKPLTTVSVSLRCCCCTPSVLWAVETEATSSAESRDSPGPKRGVGGGGSNTSLGERGRGEADGWAVPG